MTDWLNYHHLYYFWVVAVEGGITAASRKLRVAPSTLSAQVQQLEEVVGHELFHRVGRRLVLTDVGRTTREYADEIFGLGRELIDVLGGQSQQRFVRRLHVGITNVIPKLVSLKLLEPVLHLEPQLHLICREDRTERLLAELAIHHLDVIITDAPVPRDVNVRVFNHELGECTVSFYAMEPLAKRLQEGWPRSLNDAPVLLPTSESALRRQLDEWFQEIGVRPQVLAELDDSGLMKELGTTGLAAFAAPTLVMDNIVSQYGVVPVAEVPEIKERFFVVSTERKLRHPGVVALADEARARIF